jgi:hypothetical protein
MSITAVADVAATRERVRKSSTRGVLGRGPDGCIKGSARRANMKIPESASAKADEPLDSA